MNKLGPRQYGSCGSKKPSQAQINFEISPYITEQAKNSNLEPTEKDHFYCHDCRNCRKSY